MTVEIEQYSEILKQMFRKEQSRLKLILPENVIIEHVGSSSVGIGGKNIVDILIGTQEMYYEKKKGFAFLARYDRKE